MTKKLIAIFLLSSLSAFSSECLMRTSAKILKINKKLDSTCIIETNCSAKVKASFIKFLSSASGKMNPKHLQRFFKTEYGIEISFKNSLEVIDLKNYIAENLEQNNLVIENVSSLYGKASLNLENTDTLSMECKACDSPGDKNIKLKINGSSIWLSASIKIKRKGFKLTKDVPAFTNSLDASILEESFGVDDGKEGLFHDIENLRFYRARRPLERGRTLKQSDLIAKNLIKYNNSVEVLLKGDSLSLKTKALARQNGKLGQMVKLYNPKTKKVIMGKVIDYNKALVEL